MADDRNDLIKSPEQARHEIANLGRPEMKLKRNKYNHMEVASQAVKMINSSIKDPFVRKVMTLRIIGPAIIGQERSYISIALELGARESDVKAAEKYGVFLLEEIMKKTDMPEFIEKFNRERSVAEAVQNMGNSVSNGLPQ